MDVSQIALVQQSWARVAPLGNAFGALFYHNLFVADRRLRPLFNGSLGEHCTRLMGLIDTAVRNLGEPQRLQGALREAGQRHAALGFEESHYITVGLALLRTLDHSLGDDFNAEVERAWADAYECIAARIAAEAKDCVLALGTGHMAEVA